jgi:hypothetical protein
MAPRTSLVTPAGDLKEMNHFTVDLALMTLGCCISQPLSNHSANQPYTDLMIEKKFETAATKSLELL